MHYNELTQSEIDFVSGNIHSNYDFLINNADIDLFWIEFTEGERNQVLSQPDSASRRAKMLGIWRKTTVRTRGGWR